MKNSEISKTIVNYEKQILHFLQKDKRYIKEVFSNTNIKLDTFTDSNVRKVVEIIVKYYESFHNLLVKREFENYIEKSLEEKKITEEEHGQLILTYEDSEFLKLNDEQFKRIFKEWVSALIVPGLKESIQENIKLLSKGLGTEFLEKQIQDLNKFSIISKDDSVVRCYDLDAFTERHIEDVLRRRKEDLTGIRTGISNLDKVFMGFQPGSLSLIGAVTGGGKSTLAMNFSRNILEKSPRPVNILIISLEMDAEQWVRKYNVMDAFFNNIYLPYTDVVRNDGGISDELLDEYFSFVRKREEDHKERGVSYKLVEARANKWTWEELLIQWKSQLPNWEPDIVFIDYIALFRLGSNSEKRNEALGNLSKDIRAYGQDKGIPMVAIVQANRAAVQRVKGKREIDIDFENVEGSNQIIADSENFLAIIPDDNDITEVTIKVVKQREGPKRSVKVKAALEYGAFYDEEDIRSSSYFNSSVEDELDNSLDLESDLEESLEEYIDEINNEDSNGIDNLIGEPKEKTPNIKKIIQQESEKSEDEDVKRQVKNSENLINNKNREIFSHSLSSSNKNLVEGWLSGNESV